QHGGLAHGSMSQGGLAHGSMAHGSMAHGSLTEDGMAHDSLTEDGMAHGSLANGGMPHVGHGGMDHSQHAGHQMVTTPEGEAVMVMAGIPPWLFLLGTAAIIVLSFVVVERVGSFLPVGGDWRVNLIKNRTVYKIVRRRWFQAVPQLLMVGVLLFLIYAGLFGNRIGNITPVAVWTVWWAGLIFAVALMGPVFCFACPWDGLANLASRLRLAARVRTLSLALPVPRWMRNMYPALGLFVLLTWAELGLGVTTDPRGTAYMGLGMVALAVICALLFGKKAFCAYLCPVGRISGIYANFSPVEVRARNPRACRSCTTEDCLNGNELGYPCPTGISLKVVQNNTMCTLCSECVKSCHRHNVALNLRPFATDLVRNIRVRADEAWMCVTLLALTLFHGFSMTTSWEDHTPGAGSLLKWMAVTLGTPQVVNFTLGMFLSVAVPVAMYYASCEIAARWVHRTRVTAWQLFATYSYSLLPVALFYHLAHNAMHMFMEGGALVPLLSDPLATGADYFGTKQLHVGHLLEDRALWFIQVGLILVGHVVGVVVAHRLSRQLFSRSRDATKSLLPMLVMMVLISVAGLSLMVLDMNMRIGRM
ncbi:MAG: 4Fe-4S binding protein, partial [Myxococcales bacterium FL481]